MLLTVKNLKIEFKNEHKKIQALKGIDFSIKGNEVLGLVGESGSGKTITALSIMNLLSKKSAFISGEVLFGGQNLLTISDEKIRDIRGSKIAMIFQEPFTSLNPVLKVGDQIAEAILVHKPLAKAILKKETIDLLSKVRINDPERVYNSYPHLLSGGERQRIMIAMAIAFKPRLLIADEPTTALDVTIQSEILDLILKLKKDLNMSILFITHDFGIIKKIADRVLVMKEGSIVERGLTRDILLNPKDKYTKKLIEAVPKITVEAEKTKIGDVLIKVKNLNKTFYEERNIFAQKKQKIEAVSEVNLEIKKGETLGLVGESGSGKTTFGRMLINLLNKDSGEIIVGKEKMQIVFQDPFSSLDPRMPMKDIVLEGPTVHGLSKKEKEKILQDVLFKVHLNYKDRFKYPHQFSGGQRQRIAIARSLAVNPEILILDEPVSSLDVIIQSEILKLLKELQKELSLTYIFISHDLRVVRHMASTVAVMQKGRIVESGSKEDIYSSPKHPYTRKLLSSILTL